MKCVAVRACQARGDDGKVRTYRPGQIDRFSKCPTHFKSLEDPAYAVDFLTASQDELLNADWKFEDAVKVVKEAFNVDLKFSEKANVVDAILDARYRHIAGSNDKKPKVDEPKVDEPKVDEPKADEPKADEPKADEPKADESKAKAVKEKQSK